MSRISVGPYTDGQLKEAASLFYRGLSADPVFSAAFPDPEAGRRHCGEFVDAYARRGEIHLLTAPEGLAAALWSLPGERVPSPTWETEVPEPSCKLYLMVSEVPGGGKRLLRFARTRFGTLPLCTLCGAPWQRDYFLRRGFRQMRDTSFGPLLLLSPEDDIFPQQS